MSVKNIITKSFKSKNDPEDCAELIFEKDLHFYCQAFRAEILKDVLSIAGDESRAYAEEVISHVVNICRREAEDY